MIGYVRIHRSLIGHPAFRNDAEAMAFAWMIARAAWKPVRVRYKSRAIELARGQLSISQRDMAEALDRDKAWVERLWKRLRSEAMITVTSEAGVALITICNYAEYQASEDTREAVAEAPREADARQTQGTEQRREEVKKEVKARKRARDPDFPIPDFIPAEPIAAFLEMRRKKGKPVDSFTAKQLFGRLRSIADAGWSLEDVITKAVIGQHDGFWMPDGRDQNIRKINGSSAPPGKWTPERMAAYRRSADSDEDATTRAMRARSIGDAIPELFRQAGGRA